jgi:hypothetical protein
VSIEVPPDLPELMGLDSEELDRVAHRTEQWALGALESFSDRAPFAEGDDEVAAGFERLHREVGSLFAIAGGYRLLLDYPTAVESLSRSVQHFAEARSSYAHALAVCAGDLGSGWLDGLRQEGRPSNATESELLLLRLAWLDAKAEGRAEGVRAALLGQTEIAMPDGYAEAGRLGIPLSSTMRVLDAVRRIDREQAYPGALAVPVRDFLTRAYEVTSAAMSDRWHWRRLMSSVLPVEPEAAALGAVVMSVAMRHGLEDELMERLRLPRTALVPLFVGGAITEASSHPGH